MIDTLLGPRIQASVELDTAGETSIEVPSRVTPPLFLLDSGLNACDS